MTVLGVVDNKESDERSSKRSRRQADASSLGDGDVLQLGNTRFGVLRDYNGKLARFVEGCLKCQEQWTEAMACDDFDEVLRIIANVVSEAGIAQWCMIPAPQKPDSYVHGFVGRKLFLMCWLYGGLQSMTWEQVDPRSMLKIMPDATKQMDGLPSEWNAAQLSTFLHGRPDRFPFTFMWGCLFKDAVPGHREDKALRAMESGAYVSKALGLRQSTGVEHHPANVFAELLST